MSQDLPTTKFRPPIVAVMGHIDHGKTSLLDRIRCANVAAREAGGITQHISAYQVVIKTKKNKTGIITFIDTPGHAAFCQMRSRGALTTDLVVLVISAIDGVMAQTRECIDQIKKANLPVIVVANKVDLSGIQMEKVKGQLVELGLTPEEYGGQVPLISTSAKTGEGVDDLLESILLHAEVMELKNEPQSPLEAVVIESKLDKNRGPVALVIIKKGTLSIGDQVYSDQIAGKVKALFSPDGKAISQATPSCPVEILGFESVPAVGSLITDHLTSLTSTPPTSPKTTSTADSTASTLKLPIVLKADVQGTLEAILNSFSDDVKVIHAGVGPVSDNDIFLAKPANAQIFAFNVAVPRFIQNLADNEKVKIFPTKIIYEIIETVQNQVLKMLEPTIDETILGQATVIAEFNINKVRIAGIKCTKGELKPGDSVHLKRDDKIIKDTKIEGIRLHKDSVDKAKAGLEYGITFRPYVDFKLNDVIIAYKVEK